MSDTPAKSVTLQELPDLRRKTELVARYLKDHLSGHLETVRPLFSPERVLGKHAGGRIEVAGAERALVELQQNYKPFTTRPFDLPTSLDSGWLTLVGSTLDIFPWEYSVSVQSRRIAMMSPVKWVLSYRGNASLGQIRNIAVNRESGHLDGLRQFVVNTLILNLVLSRFPGLAQLLRDLRYEVNTETISDLPGLNLTTITSCLTSFRPSDDLVGAATAFSGVPSFVELIDLDSVRQPHDLLREKLDKLLA